MIKDYKYYIFDGKIYIQLDLYIPKNSIKKIIKGYFDNKMESIFSCTNVSVNNVENYFRYSSSKTNYIRPDLKSEESLKLLNEIRSRGSSDRLLRVKPYLRIGLKLKWFDKVDLFNKLSKGETKLIDILYTNSPIVFGLSGPKCMKKGPNAHKGGIVSLDFKEFFDKNLQNNLTIPKFIEYFGDMSSDFVEFH